MEAEGKMSKFKGQMIGYETRTRITDTKHNAKCQRAVAHIPGANIKEFWLTILSEANLSEAKRPQIQCSSPKSEFWICSAASFRMVKNYFR
jgi:hypothetical protein